MASEPGANPPPCLSSSASFPFPFLGAGMSETDVRRDVVCLSRMFVCPCPSLCVRVRVRDWVLGMLCVRIRGLGIVSKEGFVAMGVVHAMTAGVVSASFVEFRRHRAQWQVNCCSSSQPTVAWFLEVLFFGSASSVQSDHVARLHGVLFQGEGELPSQGVVPLA